MPHLAPFDQAALARELVSLRRDLHRHPELGFEEHRTSALVAERARRAGLDVRNLAGTGVLATLKGGRPGPTVLVRAELDALPIHETSDVAYRSVNDGVMHACAHDGHMAIATIVAEHLATLRDEIAGTVKFAYQPAEEIAGGAKQMIEEGAMEGPRVDRAVSLHLWQDLPVGTTAVAPGAIWAAVDDLTFVVHGKSGHGAMPHQTVDAIAVAAQIVTALQTVVSRTRSPFAPAVLTIGSIQGGTTWNIIADRVEMRGTLRTFDAAVRERLLGRLTAIAKGIAESMEASCEVHDRFGAPPVVNNPEVAGLVREGLLSVMGEESVQVAEQSAGGDDFAYFGETAPACLFVVGSSNPAKGLDKGHHNSGFDIDETSLSIGAACLESVIRRLLAAT